MRTSDEWSQLFSDSLNSTNRITVSRLIDLAREDARDDLLNKFRNVLLSEPYFIQPEIVEEITKKINQ